MLLIPAEAGQKPRVWVLAVQPHSFTSEEHLLQQVVDFGQAAQLDELELLDHLPGDALQRGQQQEQLSEATPTVVLPVVDVVFQTDLHLVAHALDLSRITQTFGICGSRDAQENVAHGPLVPNFPLLPRWALAELVPGSKKTMAFKQAYSLSSI